MGKKRANQAGYVKRKNSQGHNYWANVNPARRAISEGVGAAGFGASDDFLESIGKMPIMLTDDPVDQQIKREALDYMSGINNVINGDLKHDYNDKELSEIYELYQQQRDEIYEEYKQRKEQIESIVNYNPELGDSSYGDQKDNRNKQLKNLEKLEQEYENKRKVLALNFEPVIHMDEDIKTDYAKARVEEFLSHPDNLHAVMHDSETYRKFYENFVATDSFVDTEKGLDDITLNRGDEVRNEVNKALINAYGIGYKENSDGIQVPHLDIRGDSYQTKLVKAKRAEMMSHWAGITDEGIYMGDNYINPSKLSKSIIKQQRMQSAIILGRLVLGRIIRHQVEKKMYGHSPYIRYDREWKNIMRAYKKKQSQLVRDERLEMAQQNK